MRPGEPEVGKDVGVQCRKSRLEEAPNEVGMGCERLI